MEWERCFISDFSIVTYSLKKDGSKRLSANFTVREFACNDGSDTVKICPDIVARLQKIRDRFARAVTITSGYRTVDYNAKIGGAKHSQHTLGRAADIVVEGVDALKVYLYADSIGCPGVIYYPKKRFCHIDARDGRYRAICVSKNYYPEPSGNLKKGSSGNCVKWVQMMLNSAGYSLTEDGKFGSATAAAVRNFQQTNGLNADGILGAKTREKLKEVLR